MATRKSAAPKRSAKTNAISLLKEDHKNVTALLEKLAGSTSRQSKSRDALVGKIEQEIKVHSQLESEIYYPAFKEASRKKADQPLYFEAMEEHHIVDVVMAELNDGSSMDGEAFAAKCTVLKDLVEHHIRVEERQLFPAARKVLSGGQRQQLGEEINERKEELQEQPID
jgi:hemerythrin-like domain-containing protein